MKIDISKNSHCVCTMKNLQRHNLRHYFNIFSRITEEISSGSVCKTKKNHPVYAADVLLSNDEHLSGAG